jgi:hypothetical protein
LVFILGILLSYRRDSGQARAAGQCSRLSEKSPPRQP